MKKRSIIAFTLVIFCLVSCSNNNTSDHKTTDTASASAPQFDSAANNGVIPPSGNPANADNSSLADTTYKDSTKSK